MPLRHTLLRVASSLLRSASDVTGRGTRARQARRARPGGRRAGLGAQRAQRPTQPGYAGDFQGAVHVEYGPHPDGVADPGEVVWAWVPYEENDGRGKDRPVLVVGRDGDQLLALMLTSKDHDRDAADEARAGRFWMDIGTGGWDQRARPSEVRLDRVLRLSPSAVRREGSHLDRARFDEVARALTGVPGHRSWT